MVSSISTAAINHTFGSCTILLLNVHFEKNTVVSYYAPFVQFRCIHHESGSPVDSIAGKLFVTVTVQVPTD